MNTESPDNDALHDEEFKQLVAEAIVLGICDYYGVSCPNVTDPTPPTTTISLSGIVGESNWYRSDVQVTLAASDNSGGSGVKLIQYRIDSGSWQTYSIPFIVSGEEEHTVSYKAQDNADNWEDEKQTTLGIDTTAPSGTLAINNNASVTHASLVYLNATTTDNLSGVSKMRIRNASGSWTDWQSYTSQQLWQLSGSTGQIFGVEIQFKDRAGNGSIVYSDTILLDIYPDRPASTGYRLAKSTLGVSGGPSTSTGYQLRGTSGQPSTVSIMTGANYISAWGYWRAALVSSPTQPGAVYLPIILKQP